MTTTPRRPRRRPDRREQLLVGFAAGALLVVLTGCAAKTPPVGAASTGAPSTAAPVLMPAVTVPMSMPDDFSDIPGLDIDVGGVRLHVKVDTGSSGLRVNAAKVSGAAMRVVGPAQPYAYASGARLSGVLAEATLGLGPARSTTPTRFEVIQSVGCLPDHPDCPTGDGRFDGIIGLSPRSAPDLDNPLLSFGELGRVFAVHLAPRGASTLELGAPSTGFVLEDLSPAGGRGDPVRASSWDGATDICSEATVLHGRVCGLAVFDTGNPVLDGVHLPGAPARSSPPGSVVTLSTDDRRWTATYTAGAGAMVQTSGSTAPGAVGRPGFAHTDVRYDLQAGTIGLRAH